jgi:hypothetical protein
MAFELAKDPITGPTSSLDLVDPVEKRLNALEKRVGDLSIEIAVLPMIPNAPQSRTSMRCDSRFCMPLGGVRVANVGLSTAANVESDLMKVTKKVAFIFLNAIGCLSAPKIYFLGCLAGIAWQFLNQFFEIEKDNLNLSCKDGCGAFLPFNLIGHELNPVVELVAMTLVAVEHMAHHSHISFLKTFSHLGLSQFMTGASLGLSLVDMLDLIEGDSESATDSMNSID